MKLSFSMTRSSQDAVSARTDSLAGDISDSAVFLTEKLHKDIGAARAKREEISGSRDNFDSAIQAIESLTETFREICDSTKLLREIAEGVNLLTVNTSAESVNVENM